MLYTMHQLISNPCINISTTIGCKIRTTRNRVNYYYYSRLVGLLALVPGSKSIVLI